ncbi:MAG: folate family ECF transporter S component [Christensenellaceae bacterium]
MSKTLVDVERFYALYLTKERFFMQKISPKTLKVVYCAAFIAIAVLLGGFFSFYLTEEIKISLAPIPVMFAGSVLGPVFGGITGFITDLLSYLLKPMGAYFPGFSITMALYGILSGLFFYKKPKNSLLKITLVTFLTQTVCSVFVNTLWLSIMMGTPYFVLMIGRLPTTYLSFAIYTIILFVLVKNKDKIIRNL